MTEDEMVGWHHRFNGHEFEQTLGDVEGQGSLAFYSPWGCKELDSTEQLNDSYLVSVGLCCLVLSPFHSHLQCVPFIPRLFLQRTSGDSSVPCLLYSQCLIHPI